MKQKNITLALAFAGIIGAGQLCAQAPGQPVVPTSPETPKLTEKEAFIIGSYFFGYQQGRGLNGAEFKENEISKEELMKGFSAGIKGDESAIPEEKIQAAMQVLQELAQKRNKEKAERQLVEGKAFLEKNAKREGVKTTASGLQYEVIKKGGDRKYVAPAGGMRDLGTQFFVHYKGTLLDGKEFDSSAKHSTDGSPSKFTLFQVVPGFSEALRMMPVGAKWKVYIPYKLGYGANPDPRSQGGPGGPNSVLTFELELADIKAAPAPTPGAGHPPIPGRPGARATTPPVPVPVTPTPTKKEKAE